MDEIPKKKCGIPGVRYWFTAALLLGNAIHFAIRTCLNVAIVAMVNSTSVSPEEKNTSGQCFPSRNDSYISHWALSEDQEGEFSWSPEDQGQVLGAFYYGYILPWILTGRMSEMYSAKWVYGSGLLISGILTLLTPVVARSSFEGLIVLRGIEGISQAVSKSGMYALMSNWFPDDELTLHNGFIHGGISLGTWLGMTATGYLCSTHILGGWPFSFYVMGTLGCLWFLIWGASVSNTPHTHPCITERELRYITSNQRRDVKVKVPPFPWCKVLKSLPFWSFVIAHLGKDWGYIVMVTELPTFYATIMHLDVKQSGLLSSLPYLLDMVVGISYGSLSSCLVRSNYVKVKWLRIVSTILSHMVSSLFFIGLSLAGCSVTWCVICALLYVSLSNFCVSGLDITPIDLSPEYASTVVAIANTISCAAGFVIPITVGAITQDNQTLGQWRIVFLTAAAIQAFSGIFFILFSSSEKQNWLEKENSEEHLIVEEFN